MKRYVFESNRLGFRELKKEDYTHIYEMNSDPEVMKYFPEPMTVEQSNEYISKIIDHQKSYGYSKFAVELKDSGEFIGIIGLVKINFDSDIQGEVEIGWRLLKKYWHKGYATEGAEAILNYGHKILGISKIYSFTATINTPSEQVMKRIGMNFLSEFDHPNVSQDSILRRHVLYISEK